MRKVIGKNIGKKRKSLEKKIEKPENLMEKEKKNPNTGLSFPILVVLVLGATLVAHALGLRCSRSLGSLSWLQRLTPLPVLAEDGIIQCNVFPGVRIPGGGGVLLLVIVTGRISYQGGILIWS